MEFNGQVQALVGQSKIGEKLLFVNRRQHLGGVDLHDTLVCNDQIGPESCIRPNSLLHHWYDLLAGGAEPAPAELVRQHGVVDGSQQSRTEGV